LNQASETPKNDPGVAEVFKEFLSPEVVANKVETEKPIEKAIKDFTTDKAKKVKVKFCD